jgi:hypothetical protein
LGGGLFGGVEPHLGRAQHFYPREQSLRESLPCLWLCAVIHASEIDQMCGHFTLVRAASGAGLGLLGVHTLHLGVLERR